MPSCRSNPVGDFATIGLVTDVPMILVARPNFPAKDLGEMIARIRSEGDKMTFGNVGLGSASQLCGLMFMNTTDTKLTPIYYKGGGPALNDVIAGHIDVYCDPATGPTPYIQSNTIKGYAITSKKRVGTLPDVPTSAEAGVPEFDVTTWYGLYAPRGTPKPVIDRLVSALQTALEGSCPDQPLCRTQHGSGRARARDAGGARGFPEGRDRQMGTDHQGRGNRTTVDPTIKGSKRGLQVTLDWR
ncbi:tripartite-type tricarboxylate transporter receptor subunit TctC [Bradyrhizobium sp. LB7.1]